MRLCCLTVLLALAPVGAQGQDPGDVVVGVASGLTFYCIVSRCDSGIIGGVNLGYNVSSALMVQAGGRWHDCFDCDRFLIADAGVQLRRAGERLSPFVSAGGGISSDLELMGSKWGAYAALGTWVGLRGEWNAQLELRGRQVGGDSMGEFTVGVARNLRREPLP